MKGNLFFIILVILFISCKAKTGINNIENINEIQNKAISIIQTPHVNKGITENLILSYNDTADGWLKKPIDIDFNPNAMDIPIKFVTFDYDKLFEAIILLKEVFYIKLTDEEYTYFTEETKNDSRNAYLIRSVNYAFDENAFRIYKSKENNLLISHYTFSTINEGAPIQKWPIIILYNDMDKINEIYTMVLNLK